MPHYFIVLISTSVIYFFLIMAILFFGKKELSQLSIIDLVFILLISNAVQNAMVDGSWTELLYGLIAASTLFILNYLMKILIYKNKFVNKLIEGEPVLLIYHGRLNHENLQREKITHNEIQAAVREHGIEKISEVSLSVLETDGNISVISFDDSKKTVFNRRRKRLPVRASDQ